MNDRVFLLLCAAALSAAGQTVSTSYVPYRFEIPEQWQVNASGDAGASRFEGGTWTADFTRGAEWVSIAPQDRVMLGTPGKVHLRVRGGAKGHPVHVYLYTHFMTFHKVVGELAGDGEQQLVFDAPPGPGWEWFGGENDGKLHGPLRVAEIRLEANGLKDRTQLRMLDITVQAETPQDRRCVLTARSSKSNGRILFHAEPRCLSEKSLAGVLRWRLRDWDGNDLGAGSKNITIRPAAEPGALEVAAHPPAGARFVEAEFALDIPGQKVADAGTCWTGAVPPHTDDQLRPESPFGMGVYLQRFQGADMERTARVAREAGVKWSREDFQWSAFEPARGRFEWDYHDGLIATAKRHGISVYAIVAGWPAWTKPYTEEGIEDWLTFLRQLVRHYKNDIHQWEIWNEPNIFFWQGPHEMYATLLIKSYAVIKEVDPSAEVLGISTSGIDYNFIAQMLARETPFDILTIHPYRKVLDDRIFINELKIVSDLVKRPDGRRRPVWLTEMGWSTYTPHNTLRQDFQPATLRANAELLARTYLCSIVSGVEPRTFWYDFRNDGEDPLYFENELGIVYRDFRPKPSYAAFSTLARVLSGKRLAGTVAAPEGVFAHRFEGEGTTYALWSPKADAEMVLDTGAGAVSVVNTVGETREARAQGGKLRVRLRSGAPVYVVLGR